MSQHYIPMGEKMCDSTNQTIETNQTKAKLRQPNQVNQA